jgi:hypothetical protein
MVSSRNDGITVQFRISSGVQINNEQFLQTLWRNQQGQDITEYAVMLAFVW